LCHCGVALLARIPAQRVARYLLRVRLVRPSSFLFLLALAGCGGAVRTGDEAASAGAGAAGGGGAGGAPVVGSTGTGPCPTAPITCVQGCGSDYLASPTCSAGTWSCPDGFIDISTCPPGTCFGAPLPCEICGPDGWACQPEETCAGSCDGIVCAECPAGGTGTVTLGACSCSCDDSAQFTCSLAPGCCNADMDCGDALYVPCVEHVCKQPVPGGCWKDDECGPNQKCAGASVCPCGFDCDEPDTPGTCG